VVFFIDLHEEADTLSASMFFSNPLCLSIVALFSSTSCLFPASLAWDRNTEPEVAGYRAYSGFSSETYSSVIDTGQSTTLPLTNLVAGKKYYFAVTAYTADKLESDFSSEVWYVSPANIGSQFWYDFRVNGVLSEASSVTSSTSAYWWLQNGGRLILTNGVGTSLSSVTPADPFQMLLRKVLLHSSVESYVMKKSDLAPTVVKAGWNGISLFSRYVDELNYYFASIRADGYATIRKRKNGLYITLLQKKVLPGTYSLTGPTLIPTDTWIGLRFSVDGNMGYPRLTLHADFGRTGIWSLLGEVTDDPAKFGPALEGAGLNGIRSDFPLHTDDFRLEELSAPIPSAQPLVYPSMLVEDETTESIPVALHLEYKNSVPKITVTGPCDGRFALLRSHDLSNWEQIHTGTMGTTEYIYTDDSGNGGRAFYRVIKGDG
jgi:hypothetical protein